MDDLLKYAVDRGMIDLSYVQEQMRMDERAAILEKHPYSIWHGNDGKWHTYLPDEEKGRVPRKRNSQREIEDVVIEFWAKPKTFKAAYFHWRKTHDLTLSNNSIVRYNTDYKRYFKDSKFEAIELEKLNEDAITAFMITTVKNKTKCKKACKTLFGYVKNTVTNARKNKFMDGNPVEFLRAAQFYKFCKERKRPLETLVVSDDRMGILNKRFEKDHLVNPNYIPTYAVQLASLTGMRVGELSALRWDDIQGDTIRIDESEKYDRLNKKYVIEKTKNEKERVFPITPEIRTLLETVERIEKRYGYFCEWVFANEDGRIHAPVISSCSKNKCRQTQITEVGIHAYRRTFNSKLRCAGVPAVVASSLLGHSEQVNDQYYTFDIIDMESKANMVALLNKKTSSLGEAG